MRASFVRTRPRRSLKLLGSGFAAQQGNGTELKANTTPPKLANISGGVSGDWSSDARSG